MTLEETATYNSNSLRRYVNLDEELRKVYIGQFRKKQRKAGDAAGLCGVGGGIGGGGIGGAGSKTLDRNHFSRIRVSVKFAPFRPVKKPDATSTRPQRVKQ